MKRTFLFLLLVGGLSLLGTAKLAAEEVIAKDTLGAHYTTYIEYSNRTAYYEKSLNLRICNKTNWWRHGLLGFDMGQVSSKREKVLLGITPYAETNSDDFFHSSKSTITTYTLAIYALKRTIKTPTCWTLFYGKTTDNPPGEGFSYKAGTGGYPLNFPESDMEKVGEITVTKTDSMKLLTVDITNYINQHINTNDTIYFFIACPTASIVSCSVNLKSNAQGIVNSPKLLLFEEKNVVSISEGREMIAGETDTLRIYFPTNAVAPFAVSYTDGKDTFKVSNILTNEYKVAVAPTVTTTYTPISANDAQREIPVEGEATYTIIQPNVKISGKNKIYQGDATTLNLTFVGKAPYSYTVVGTDGSSYSKSNITNANVTLSVVPSATCTYTIQSASDVNNPSILTSGDAVVTVIDRPLPNLTVGADNWQFLKGDEFGQEAIDTKMWKLKTGEPKVDGECLLLGVDKAGTSFAVQQMQMAEAMPTATDMYLEVRMKPMPVTNTGFEFYSNAYTPSQSSKYKQRYSLVFPTLKNLGDNTYNFRYSLIDWKTNYYYSQIDPTKTLYSITDSVMGRTCGEYMVLGLELTATNARFYIDGELVSEAVNMEGFNSSKFIDTLTAPGSAFQDVAELAYGYYGQEDWHYYGGYAGDIMAMQLGATIDVATFQEADLDKVAAIDYVRFFHKKSDMAPTQKDITFEETTAQTTIALDTTINTQIDNTFYFSTLFTKTPDSEFSLSLLDPTGQVVAGAIVNTSNAIRAGFGSNKVYYASTVSAQPTSKKSSYYLDNQLYLMVGRIQTQADGDDVISISTFPVLDTKNQPYFYPNIEGEYGHTAYGNGWDINQKYEIDAAGISQVRFDGTGEFRCRKFLVSSSFDGVVPHEAIAILDNDPHYIGAGEVAKLNVKLSGTAPWTLKYKEGSTEHEINNIMSSPYVLECKPTVSTTYSLVSLTDGNGNAGIAFGANTVKVKSSRATDLYPYYDTFVDGNQPTTPLHEQPTGMLKKHATYERDAYFRFDISEYDPTDSMSVANFSFYLLTNDQSDEVQLTLYQVLSGMPDPIEDLNFTTAPKEDNMKSLGTITAPAPGFYGVRATWDIRKFINKELKSGSGIIDLCVKVTGGNTNSLINWRQYVADSVELESQLPYLALDPYEPTDIEGVIADAAGSATTIQVYPNPAKNYVNVVGNYEGKQAKIISAAGQVMAITLVQGNRIALPANYQGMAYILVETEKGYAATPIIIQ